jgi:hypothetical protein
MSVCVENCSGEFETCEYFVPSRPKMLSDAHGGTLINLIHAYTDNGDPFVREFTDQLLEEVCEPEFCVAVADFLDIRCQNHSLCPCIDGYSQESCTIRLMNFSCLVIQSLHIIIT